MGMQAQLQMHHGIEPAANKHSGHWCGKTPTKE
jgi:hypothetical protein